MLRKPRRARRRVTGNAKPTLVILIVFTALVDIFLGSHGLPPPAALLYGIVGIALASANGVLRSTTPSACAANA